MEFYVVMDLNGIIYRRNVDVSFKEEMRCKIGVNLIVFLNDIY